MNLAEKVLGAMSEIDERYLEGSEKVKSSFFVWKPAYGVLALCALIIGVTIVRPDMFLSKSGSSDSAMPADTAAINSLGTDSYSDSLTEESSAYEADGGAKAFAMMTVTVEVSRKDGSAMTQADIENLKVMFADVHEAVVTDSGTIRIVCSLSQSDMELLSGNDQYDFIFHEESDNEGTD